MRLRKTITTIVATAILLAGWQLFAVIANQPEPDTFTSPTRTDTLRMARLRVVLSVGRSDYTPGNLRHVDLIRLCDRDGRVIRPF